MKFLNVNYVQSQNVLQQKEVEDLLQPLFDAICHSIEIHTKTDPMLRYIVCSSHRLSSEDIDSIIDSTLAPYSNDALEQMNKLTTMLLSGLQRDLRWSRNHVIQMLSMLGFVVKMLLCSRSAMEGILQRRTAEVESERKHVIQAMIVQYARTLIRTALTLRWIRANDLTTQASAGRIEPDGAQETPKGDPDQGGS